MAGDIVPGTETSARYKQQDGAEEWGQEILDDPAPRRPTSNQGPRALGGRCLGLGQGKANTFFFCRDVLPRCADSGR